MLINVMLLVSIKACTRILFSLFLCNYHHLKAGNLLKLKNLKETGTVCKLKYFLIYRESYRHRNIEQCYRISHILLISCRPITEYQNMPRLSVPSFGTQRLIT